jgi:hypothetical protein
MIDPQSHKQLQTEISERIKADKSVLDQLREEIRPLRDNTCLIHPRGTTSISLVAADGGNNQIQYDPFLVQLVRVVDSSNNEYCLEAITPTTRVGDLSAKQFDGAGQPITALGELMSFLGEQRLDQMSHMIRSNDDGWRCLQPEQTNVEHRGRCGGEGIPAADSR